MKLKTIKRFAVAGALVLAALWGLNQAFDLFPCGGTIYAMAPSPDKKFTAYAFERDCGATTDFASFVILRYGSEKFDITADLDRNEIVFQSDGDYQPALKWLSSDTLQVSFDKGAPSPSEVSFQVVKSGDTQIQYRGLR